MTLKTLVTGVAAAAAISGVAMGVTSIASPAIAGADPSCVSGGELEGVLNGLAAPGVKFRDKSNLIEGGVGIIEGKTADRLLTNAYATGSLPVTIDVVDSTIACSPDNYSATATVNAGSRSQPVTFVNQGGWKLSKSSATAVLSAFGG